MQFKLSIFLLFLFFSGCFFKKSAYLKTKFQTKKNILVVYTAPTIIKDSADLTNQLILPESFSNIKYNVGHILKNRFLQSNIIVPEDHLTTNFKVPISPLDIDTSRIPKDTLIVAVQLFVYYESILVGLQRKEYNVLLEVNLQFYDADIATKIDRNQGLGSIRMTPVEDKTNINLLAMEIHLQKLIDIEFKKYIDNNILK